ncbi:hypothetical protein Tco_0296175 [Tanacetum coccineum]
MRMEQYIQMVDYSLWDVIENGNAPPVTKVVEGVETIISPATAEEKAQRRLELKKRFGGNAATKKTQRNLLKQRYENFTASSSEELDQTFDRLQKLISQLEIHGETISQEDVNQNNTNGAVNSTHGATTASTQATAVNSSSIDNLSDVVICEDLFKVVDGYVDNEGKEILEEHWKETFLQGSKEPKNMNKDNTIRVVPVELTTSNALVSYDGAGYDWSNQAKEGPTNLALVTYTSISSSSEVSTDSNCSSSCLENVKILKE